MIKQALLSVSDKAGLVELARGLAGSAAFRHAMNQLQTCAEQMAAVNEFFSELAANGRRLQYIEELAA